MLKGFGGCGDCYGIGRVVDGNWKFVFQCYVIEYGGEGFVKCWCYEYIGYWMFLMNDGGVDVLGCKFVYEGVGFIDWIDDEECFVIELCVIIFCFF